MVNGILYLSAPNHVYALDARTGRQVWHYVWRGRNAIGNRGVGMLGNAIFMVNPDNSVVSLDATTGKERWSRKLTAADATNWSTSAPVVIKNHVLVGIGGTPAAASAFSSRSTRRPARPSGSGSAHPAPASRGSKRGRAPRRRRSAPARRGSRRRTTRS